MAGLLRWDPAVAPAAPAGYLGDAATLHTIVGAPFQVDGVPANFFRIANTDGTIVGQTSDFTVMGKLRGPLETSIEHACPRPDAGRFHLRFQVGDAHQHGYLSGDDLRRDGGRH